MKANYLGIDIGTSGTKCLLMSAAGKVLATATAEHPISSPRPLWSEQDPRDWWTSSTKAARAALAKAGVDGSSVAAIGLSGQMHGLVITDAAGEPLRPAMLWNDQRTAAEAHEIETAVGGRRKLIAAVGNVAMTSFTLTKLLWVRRNEPRVYNRIRHLLLPKDYVRLRLTGEYVGDVSDMSGTLLLDQRKRDWSSKMLSLFQIDRDILPPVMESHEVSGRLTTSAAKALGIPVGTPVVAGGGDQPVGAVGNGVVVNGLTSAALGTSGVVYVHSRDYVTDPAGGVQTFCSCVEGQWCLFGCILAAGGSMRWFRNTLGTAEIDAAKRMGISPYDLLDALADEAPPGCEGLFFLPYLTGERTPHADPHARACWIGIHARTTRRELIRSVMEGAVFAMNDAVTALREQGLPIRQIRLSCGGARSAMLRQLQANIYGVTCATIHTEEGPSYGAAILAAVGAGEYKDVPQACKAIIRVDRTYPPDVRAKKVYHRHYAHYRKLYPSLKARFAEIPNLTL